MDVDDAAEVSCQHGDDDTANIAEADDDDDDGEDEEIQAILIALMSLTVDAPAVLV